MTRPTLNNLTLNNPRSPVVNIRTRRLGIAVAGCVGVIALSGCSMHPGQAAVVNGSDISQGSVDDLVHAGCNFFAVQRAQSGEGTATPISFLRNLFTQNLISFKIIDKAAAQMHLTVSPAIVAEKSQNQSLPAGMNPEDRRRLREFLLRSTRADLQQAVIGAHLKDPSVTNADNVTEDQIDDAKPYLKQFTLKQHVSVNPAYGTWRHGELLDTDGSLSAAQSAPARRWLEKRQANSDGSGDGVEGLPPSQVCG